MADIDGASVLVEALRREGVDTIFNLPGDPVGTILTRARAADLSTITFRHEQAAAMAAQAYGYVLRRLGVGVVASGPAMTNVVTGLDTAWANCWPLLMIGGASELRKKGLGDFQETPQVESAAPFCKWSIAVDDVRRIPWFVTTAVRKAMSGRPGPVYLDMPSDIITGQVAEEEVAWAGTAPPPSRPSADATLVAQALGVLRAAQRPLLLIGKGVAWSDGAAEARAFVERFQIPFLPSPMGKGVVPDDHPLNVAGARSFALRQADVIVLAGARFNWIFHFGRPPRFDPNVKVVQIDIEPDEIGNNVPATVGLVGDAAAVLQQLTGGAGARGVGWPAWRQALAAEEEKNAAAIQPWIDSEESPVNFYRMYRDINTVAPRDALIVADGESTMAISRVMQPNHGPRQRLDAGVSGCMGVGVPYAIGAQVAAPGRRVICASGDYAFGWNGMEIETAVRHDLPVTFVVANNGTIGGPAQARMTGLPASELGIRYDKMMEAFGGHSEHVATAKELRPALERSLASGKASLINVVVDPRGPRKEQPYSWLDRLGRMRYTA